MFSGLNKDTRNFIKNMVLLYASDMIRMCRTIYRKIKLDVTEESIIDDFKYIRDNSVKVFTRRCTETLNGTPRKINYVKQMVKLHVIPIIDHIVSVYKNRLAALDTVNILDPNAPRFFYSNKITEINEITKDIKLKLMTLIVYIKS
jgi:hypothetical protein